MVKYLSFFPVVKQHYIILNKLHDQSLCHLSICSLIAIAVAKSFLYEEVPALRYCEECVNF